MSNITYDMPFEAAATKIAIYGVALWAGAIIVKKVLYNHPQEFGRKHRRFGNRSYLDYQIDRQNVSAGLFSRRNEEVPYYSRYNYNRKRRMF